MGCATSSSEPPMGTGQPKSLKENEFRRGDRVLLVGENESVLTPELRNSLKEYQEVQQKRIHVPSSSNSPNAEEGEKNPLESRENTNSSTFSGSYMSGSGPVGLPPLPPHLQGWVVLAVDYRLGLYAVQLANGSYVPVVSSTEMRLLIARDWQITSASVSHSGSASPSQLSPGSMSLVVPSPTKTTASGKKGSSGTGGANGNKNKGNEKPFALGMVVMAQTRFGRYSGIVCYINPMNGLYNVQSDFGDYFQMLPRSSLEELTV